MKEILTNSKYLSVAQKSIIPDILVSQYQFS
jgi:hypothetical protein